MPTAPPEGFSSSPFRDENGNGGGSGGGSSNPPRVVHTRTRRGVPPAQWILNNAQLLEEIFGRAYLRVFHTANGKRLELGYVFRSSPLMVVLSRAPLVYRLSPLAGAFGCVNDRY